MIINFFQLLYDNLEINLAIMENNIIKTYVQKSKACSSLLLKYKIKLSIISVDKKITRDIQFYNQAIINQSIQLINTNPKLCEKHI